MDKPIAAPPLRWFFSSARRHIAWRYWVHDVVLGLLYTLYYLVFRNAAIDTCSVAGDWAGDFARRHINFDLGAPRKHRGHEARARENWAILRPEDDAAKAAASVNAAFRQTMRTFAEMPILEKLWPAGRISVVGAEHVSAAKAAMRPTLIAGLHLANWEVIWPTLVGLGYSVAAVYQPPPNRFDHRLSIAIRRRFGGTLIPGRRGGGRIAYRALADTHDVLLMYIDELVNEHLYAPFLGRPVKAEGNIAYAARLAALTGAVIIPAYCTRLGGARFRVTFMPPVDLVSSSDREADVLENVARLDTVIEPVIRFHLDQWLWLFDARIDRAEYLGRLKSE
ncbi:MAG: lysophospholipid acyltransferase family protein [Burkholderiales bacterium]